MYRAPRVSLTLFAAQIVAAVGGALQNVGFDVGDGALDVTLDRGGVVHGDQAVGAGVAGTEGLATLIVGARVTAADVCGRVLQSPGAVLAGVVAGTGHWDNEDFAIAGGRRRGNQTSQQSKTSTTTIQLPDAHVTVGRPLGRPATQDNLMRFIFGLLVCTHTQNA